jgi:hypothetical protein
MLAVVCHPDQVSKAYAAASAWRDQREAIAWWTFLKDIHFGVVRDVKEDLRDVKDLRGEGRRHSLVSRPVMKEVKNARDGAGGGLPRRPCSADLTKFGYWLAPTVVEESSALAISTLYLFQCSRMLMAFSSCTSFWGLADPAALAPSSSDGAEL